MLCSLCSDEAARLIFMNSEMQFLFVTTYWKVMNTLSVVKTLPGLLNKALMSICKGGGGGLLPSPVFVAQM
jgi:hypothetical protein